MNPDGAGRKAFIKVYRDALVKVFDSETVANRANAAFRKAYAAAGGKQRWPPMPGCATRLRRDVLQAFKDQASMELAAFSTKL